MKRTLLLLALLPAAAFATDINVSVTYTAGAAAAAAAAGTTVEARTRLLIGNINTAYTNSGISIQLVPFFDSGPTRGAPADSASMQAQFNWAQNSVLPLQLKTFSDASFSIQISDPGIGVTTGAMPAAIPTTSKTAVASLPYSFLGTQLEYAISTMIGAGTGYSKRARTYNSDPYYQGAAVCFHSRESPLSDTSQSVPALGYYQVDAGGGYVSQAATAQGACDAWMLALRNTGGQPSGTYNTAVAASGTCTIRNTVSAVTNLTSIITGNTASGPVSCTDVTIDKYSSATTLVGLNTPYYLGDATHDSVAAMNARAVAVSQFQSSNATLLNRAKAGLWATLKSWIFG